MVVVRPAFALTVAPPGGTVALVSFTRSVKSLARSPLVEATFELRFSSADGPVGDVLPGMLFARLRERYRTVEALPAAQVPRVVRDGDATLRYMPTHRLLGGDAAVQIGDHVLSVVAPARYPGWTAFGTTIREVLDALRQTELPLELERHSLKYLNVLDAPVGQQLGLLEATLLVQGSALPETAMALRFERSSGDHTLIVQLRTGVEVMREGIERRRGLMVDVDAIAGSQGAFWERSEEHLHATHEIVKQSFFALLKESTIETLGPSWEGDDV